MEQYSRFREITSGGADFVTRRLYISGEITQEKVMDCWIPALSVMDQESEAPVFIFIFTDGGNDGAGYALHDFITSMRSPVTTIGLGRVQSMGVVLLQAGSIRLMAPNAIIGFHDGKSMIQGEVGAKYIADLLQVSVEHDDHYKEVIARRCGTTPLFVSQWCKGELNFRAEHAVDKGLADALYLGEVSLRASPSRSPRRQSRRVRRESQSRPALFRRR